MTAMDQDISAVLRTRLEQLELQIESAITNAQNGKHVDIIPMQKSALHFCESVVKLPAREAKSFQSGIADIIRKLDALEKALHD